MKKPRILLIIGVVLLVSAVLLALLLPPLIEDQMNSQIEDFDISSLGLSYEVGTPPPSPRGDIPLLMGNLTFLSLLWDKVMDEGKFPWEQYSYLPTVDMIKPVTRDIAVDPAGIYLPTTGQEIPLITGGYINNILNSDKLYCEGGFCLHDLQKTSYTVEDLLTKTPINVSFKGETQTGGIPSYIYWGYRNTTGHSVREVLDTLSVSPELFTNGTKEPVDNGFTEPLHKRFSCLVNTSKVRENQVVKYYMAQHLGVPLNIILDYEVFLDFPRLSEVMLNEGFIKTVFDGEITVSPLFRSFVESPGDIRQVVIFNITLPEDSPQKALIQQHAYFVNATTGEQLPGQYQLARAPLFAVDRKTLSYTSYPGASNRTGVFIPPYKEPTARSLPIWDEVANASGNALYRGPLQKDNDTFIQYVLYQEDINFTDIPIFHNISTVLNLDILYDGTTTYLLNQTTGFVYDIIFEGEFKLYIPLSLLPIEITLGKLDLSFNSTFQDFMKEASHVIHSFKSIENTTISVGSLHLQYTPSLTSYFSSLRGDAIYWTNILNAWLPLSLGIIGGTLIVIDTSQKRRQNRY